MTVTSWIPSMYPLSLQEADHQILVMCCGPDFPKEFISVDTVVQSINYLRTIWFPLWNAICGLDITNSYCKDCKPFLLLLICQNLCKMGSCLLTIRREDLTIFLLGQLLTKTKEYFVLNNRKLISIAMCKEPQLFS